MELAGLVCLAKGLLRADGSLAAGCRDALRLVEFERADIEDFEASWRGRAGEERESTSCEYGPGLAMRSRNAIRELEMREGVFSAAGEVAFP